MIGLAKSTKKKHLSILKDPFKTKSLTRINLRYSNGLFGGKWKWSGTVYFKNGQTSGNQDFENEDFDAITAQIHSFIESL